VRTDRRPLRLIAGRALTDSDDERSERIITIVEWHRTASRATGLDERHHVVPRTIRTDDRRGRTATLPDRRLRLDPAAPPQNGAVCGSEDGRVNESARRPRSEEASVAAAPKTAIDNDFLGNLTILVSSDSESIAAGCGRLAAETTDSIATSRLPEHPCAPTTPIHKHALRLASLTRPSPSWEEAAS